MAPQQMQVGGPGVRRGGGHRAAAAGGGGGGAYPIQDLMNQVYGGMNRAAARDERSHRHAGIDRPRSIAAAAAGRSAAAATSSSRSRSSRPGNNIMILLCLSTRMYPTSLRRLCIYSTNSPLICAIYSTNYQALQETLEADVRSKFQTKRRQEDCRRGVPVEVTQGIIMMTHIMMHAPYDTYDTSLDNAISQLINRLTFTTTSHITQFILLIHLLFALFTQLTRYPSTTLWSSSYGRTSGCWR